MADETQDASRRSKIIRGRLERRAYNRPHVPWHARVWNWFMPGTYRREDEKRNRGIVVGTAVLVLVLLAVIAYNLFLAPSAYNTRIVVADGVFATGQEGNIIGDFESQGFQRASYEEGLGVVAYGTQEMVNQYRESFGSQHLDAATDVLAATHDDVGIASVNHSEGWDEILIATFTDEVDVDLFQFVLTSDANVANALDEWIAWGTMMNGNPVRVSMLDATGSRYFEADGISSVADILAKAKESNPEGIDWNEVTEGISQAASDQEGTPQGSEDEHASETTDEPASEEKAE